MGVSVFFNDFLYVVSATALSLWANLAMNIFIFHWFYCCFWRDTFFHVFSSFFDVICFRSCANNKLKNHGDLERWKGPYLLILIAFSGIRLFLQVSLFINCFKIQRVKSIHRRSPWAQNIGNHWRNLCFHCFCSYLRFCFFVINIQNNDFRGPFGSAPVEY